MLKMNKDLGAYTKILGSWTVCVDLKPSRRNFQSPPRNCCDQAGRTFGSEPTLWTMSPVSTD